MELSRRVYFLIFTAILLLSAAPSQANDKATLLYCQQQVQKRADELQLPPLDEEALKTLSQCNTEWSLLFAPSIVTQSGIKIKKLTGK